MTACSSLSIAGRYTTIIEKLDPEDPQVLYNIGLGYADLKDYDKSLKYAHKAYKAGVRFTGLRDRLQRAGRWRDASG